MGSDPGCAIVLPARPEVASRHVAIKRSGDRVFFNDQGGVQGTYIDGVRLQAGRWFEVTRYDSVYLGPLPLKLGNLLFSNTDRLGLKTPPIHFKSRNGTVLCAGAHLSATPGTLTAVIGPSGSGKTVFMNQLAGYFSGVTHSLQKTASNQIGYAEQFEALYPDLTIGQSLDYRLRLRFPGMEDRVRQKLIESSCRELGFGRDNLSGFLDRLIGVPGDLSGGLSGGERRRVHIAHELVLQPRVLLLDEPTSGLSSNDAECILHLLRSIADDLGITVIMTLHQPNAAQLKCVDHILLLASGGRPAFYGPTLSMSDDLSRISGISAEKDENAADHVLRLLADKSTCDRICETYFRSHHENGASEIHEAERVPISKNRIREQVRPNFTILFERCLRAILNSRRYQLVAFLMPVFLGIIIIVAFAGYKTDEKPLDIYFHTLHHFQQMRKPYEKDGLPIPVDKIWSQADILASAVKAETSLISMGAARNRASIYFLLVSAVAWFGVMAGCREIVEERLPLFRELRSGLVTAGSFLSSKVIALVAVVYLQTAIVTFIVAPMLLDADLSDSFCIASALLPMAFGSISIGLLVSACCRNLRTALVSVPLVLLPQLLLGGLLRPFASVEIGMLENVRILLSWFTLQRWGFELVLRTDFFALQGVIVQNYAPDDGGRYGKLAILGVRENGLLQMFFGSAESPAVAVLACLMVGVVCLFFAKLLISRKEL